MCAVIPVRVSMALLARPGRPGQYWRQNTAFCQRAGTADLAARKRSPQFVPIILERSKRLGRFYRKCK